MHKILDAPAASTDSQVLLLRFGQFRMTVMAQYIVDGINSENGAEVLGSFIILVSCIDPNTSSTGLDQIVTTHF